MNQILTAIQVSLLVMSVIVVFGATWPLIFGLFWQTIVGSGIHKIFGKTSKKYFSANRTSLFYIPTNDDPLVIHWHKPTLKGCVSAFLTGFVLAAICLQYGNSVLIVLKPIYILAMIILLIRRGIKITTSKLQFREGVEQIIFTTAAIAKMFISLEIVNVYLV